MSVPPGAGGRPTDPMREADEGVAADGRDRPSGSRAAPRAARLVRLGGLLWVVGAVQFVVAMLVVQFAWTTPYHVLSNAISDLGAVGCRENAMGTSYVCSPWHTVFNGSIVVFGALVAVGAVAVGPILPRRRAAVLGVGLLIVAGIGAAIVGLFPEDTVGAAHGLGALLAFGGSAAALVALGVAMADPPWRAGYRPFTLACGAISGGVLVASFVRPEYGPLGFGGLERLIVAPALLWLTVVGLRVLRARTLAAPAVAG